jgi:hypothetical protein
MDRIQAFAFCMEDPVSFFLLREAHIRIDIPRLVFCLKQWSLSRNEV